MTAPEKPALADEIRELHGELRKIAHAVEANTRFEDTGACVAASRLWAVVDEIRDTADRIEALETAMERVERMALDAAKVASDPRGFAHIAEYAGGGWKADADYRRAALDTAKGE